MPASGKAEPDWDDIRVFHEVARAGTLSGAAGALGLSQPAVGRRLRRLEARLGRLFDRLPNRLVPTPLGEELQAAAARMAEHAAALSRQAWARTSTARQPVRITATGSVSLFLATRMAELLAATAGSGAEIGLISSRSTLSLARREAEIALRMRRMPEEGELAARRIGRLGFALYAAGAYWQARGGPGEDWRGVAVIGLPETTRAPSQSQWLDNLAQMRGAKIAFRASELALRHRAVQDGLGVSLLPCFLGDADPGLVRVLAPPPALAEDIFLLLHQDLREVAAVRAACAALGRVFRRHEAALAGMNGLPA